MLPLVLALPVGAVGAVRLVRTLVVTSGRVILLVAVTRGFRLFLRVLAAVVVTLLAPTVMRVLACLPVVPLAADVIGIDHRTCEGFVIKGDSGWSLAELLFHACFRTRSSSLPALS